MANIYFNTTFNSRLLWLVLVVLSWYGSALLIIAAWDSFVSNPISFGVETTYIHWDTKMPAVALCELENKEKIYNVSDTIWTVDHLLDLEDVLRDITYFRGNTHSLVDICYQTRNPDPKCPMSNYTYYAKLVRSDCHDLIKNCSYNEKEFACCDYFQPIDTDIGTCFIINSIQTENPKPYPLVSNMKNKPGTLKMAVKVTSMLYTLGEDEVPTVTTLQSSTLKITVGNYYRRQVSVRNIENHPQIIQTSPDQRACFFHEENEGGIYPVYSYSSCTVQCRKMGQLGKCGCNDHFMVNTSESERCNISGMVCLHRNSNTLTTLKAPWDNRPGLNCSCLPSCNETEITVIKDDSYPIKGKANRNKALIDIKLAYLATERFKRNLVRSRMDLVVSIGGTTGLFVGASLLSFVELIFYFTVRYISNILMDRRRRHQELEIEKNPFAVKVNEKLHNTMNVPKARVTFKTSKIVLAKKHVASNHKNQTIPYRYSNLDTRKHLPYIE